MPSTDQEGLSHDSLLAQPTPLPPIRQPATHPTHPPPPRKGALGVRERYGVLTPIKKKRAKRRASSIFLLNIDFDVAS